MSNFGQLGSAMVRDAVSAGNAYMRMDSYDQNQPQRDLASQNAEMQKAKNDEAIGSAGDINKWAKQEAKAENASRQRKLEMEKLHLIENLKQQLIFFLHYHFLKIIE